MMSPFTNGRALRTRTGVSQMLLSDRYADSIELNNITDEAYSQNRLFQIYYREKT
jgi:hypothetical protein